MSLVIRIFRIVNGHQRPKKPQASKYPPERIPGADCKQSSAKPLRLAKVDLPKDRFQRTISVWTGKQSQQFSS